VIQVENLTKYYGRTLAVENVTFSVNQGEILGFLGPNGAGKTTTLRVITGFLGASSGTVKVDGFDVFDEPLEVRKRIGYLPETVPLYPEMRVREYLGFFATVRGVPRDRRPARVDEAIAKAGVGEVADKVIGRLSKGFRQRVGIAQALVHDPPVVVLDEPTIGLDPRQIIETRRLIRGLGKSHTVILSTHILPEVSMTCNKVIIINQGRIVAQGTPEKLTSDLQREGLARVVVSGPIDDVRRKLDGVPGVMGVTVARKLQESLAEYEVRSRRGEDVRPRLANAVVEGGWQLLELRSEGMTLEEIFLKVIASEKGVQEDAA